MHIVTTSEPHTIKLVPRAFPTGDIVMSIRDEDTRKEWDHSASSDDYTVTDNFLELDFSPAQGISITEGRFYTFRIKEGNTELYRGKIFCTDQTDFEKYTTINNTYSETESSSTNQYKFRWVKYAL